MNVSIITLLCNCTLHRHYLPTKGIYQCNGCQSYEEFCFLSAGRTACTTKPAWHWALSNRNSKRVSLIGSSSSSSYCDFGAATRAFRPRGHSHYTPTRRIRADTRGCSLYGVSAVNDLAENQLVSIAEPLQNRQHAHIHHPLPERKGRRRVGRIWQEKGRKEKTNMGGQRRKETEEGREKIKDEERKKGRGERERLKCVVWATSLILVSSIGLKLNWFDFLRIFVYSVSQKTS